MDTNFLFKPGHLSIIMDGQAGSSGKGKFGSYVTTHADNWQFCCNTFYPNAGHWVKLDDGREFFYQTLNSCAYNHAKYEKMYIGPGATIELPAFWRELEQNDVPRHKIGISPITSILQNIDGGYERGTHDFNGTYFDRQDEQGLSKAGGPLAKTGTTAHGCGANRARRVLRRPEAKYARDLPELREFICDVPREIMDRLDRGQAGLLEIAQGFQLSYLLPDFFPFCTSRNCTVAAGLDDLMVPPYYAGNVILNFRTFPIRINSNKYVCRQTGRHLTWDEVKQRQAVHGPDMADCGIHVIEGNSGHGYGDQQEITWEELTKLSGSPAPITEITSVTKLPRRVFTFSRQNLEDAIRHNRTNGGAETYLSVNFMNYVDHEASGRRGKSPLKALPQRAKDWINTNLGRFADHLVFVGTGALTDDVIEIMSPCL